MKLAIMQPYFLPYIGYFQLLNAVDTFVIYDNIKYTKKGWINRNRFLQNGNATDFSIALRKDSDSLCVRDRVLSPEFNKTKLLNQIKEAYRQGPYFKTVYPLFEKIVNNTESNLFQYIFFSVKEIAAYLNIQTNIVVSSTVTIDHGLKAEEKVLALCKHFGADVYINAIGGQELYNKDFFKAQEIDLKFIKSLPVEYNQFDQPFVPYLSILDVMMFNDKYEVMKLLGDFILV